MDWKHSSVKSDASSSSSVEKNEHMTFKPTIFTSNDTSSKYKVQPKTKELTIQAGSVHVERYAKARLSKAEAEKKLYGTGKAKPVQTTRPGYSLKMATSAQSSSRPNRSVDTQAFNVTTTINTTSSDNSTAEEPRRNESHGKEKLERSATKQVPGGQESRNNVLDTTVDGRKMREQQSADRVDMDNEDIATPGMDMTLRDMEEHLSIVQVLERERREWHAERAKLTHCIHLQQIELASRSSAAQETAALIAQEFARVIKSFEERLEKVESTTHKELAHIKDILVKSGSSKSP